MFLQHNAYEINHARLQNIEQEAAKFRQATQAHKKQWQVKSSKRLIAIYLFILNNIK